MVAPKKPEQVVIVFTGAAGATSYSYHVGEKLQTMRPGDQARVVLRGHWLALLESGNAEIQQ